MISTRDFMKKIVISIAIILIVVGFIFYFNPDVLNKIFSVNVKTSETGGRQLSIQKTTTEESASKTPQKIGTVTVVAGGTTSVEIT